MKIKLKKSSLLLILFFGVIVLLACCFSLLIFGALGRYSPRSVTGPSMSPTLSDGELIITEGWLDNIEAGDIVIYESNGTDLIHRVSAIEGETIMFLDGQLYINKILESYSDYTPVITELPTNGEFQEGQNYFVPSGHVLLLGDNRSNARDSRFNGFVRLKDIKAKYLFTYYRPNAKN